jgi:hypothetical protein
MADQAEQIEYMLTTVDNPFDPFTQFKEWLAFDTAHGYHTASLLDRVTYYSDELSEADQLLAIRQGIDEVVRENVSGMHRKVARGQMVQT